MTLFKGAVEAVGDAVEQVGDAVDKNTTSKEEKMTLDNADRANARDMQKAAYAQDDKFTKRAVFYLAYFWSAAAVLYIFLVSFLKIPENNQRLVDTITGFLLGTIIALILNFYFGSSHGSQAKTEQTEGLIKRIFNKKD